MPTIALKSTPYRTKPHAWPFFLSFCKALAGCNKAETWDADFAGEGQEQSVASIAGDTADQAGRKAYPFTIDFHLRSKQISLVEERLLEVEGRQQLVRISGQCACTPVGTSKITA